MKKTIVVISLATLLVANPCYGALIRMEGSSDINHIISPLNETPRQEPQIQVIYEPTPSEVELLEKRINEKINNLEKEIIVLQEENKELRNEIRSIKKENSHIMNEIMKGIKSIKSLLITLLNN